MREGDGRYVVTSCLICSAPSVVLAHGVVAPFVSELSGLPLGQATALRHCHLCDVSFFDLRYSEQQLSSIYGDYRNAAYVTHRRRWEPWYSSAVNEAYSADTAQVLDRRAFFEDVLASAVPGRLFECALDFGGDQGQFFPETGVARRIVCEASSRSLREGVERVANLSELDVRPDLVIISHVLEHLSDPLSALRQIRDVVSAGSILYAEVPLDRFRTSPFHGSHRYARYLERLVRHRSSFVAADLVTGIGRQYFGRIPSLGVVKESEHITYFSPRSLDALLAASGFQPLGARSDPTAKVGGLRLGRHGLVAKAS